MTRVAQKGKTRESALLRFSAVALPGMASVAHLAYGVVRGSGHILSMPHSAGMQSSLPLLMKNCKFTKVFIWGKLKTTDADYLNAMGIEETYATKKFFFWCVSLAFFAPRSSAWLPAVGPVVTGARLRWHATLVSFGCG